MLKILALTEDGKMTFCTADKNNIGKGRCNHIQHQIEGENKEEFLARVNILQKYNIDDKYDSSFNKNVQNMNAPMCVTYEKFNDSVINVAGETISDEEDQIRIQKLIKDNTKVFEVKKDTTMDNQCIERIKDSWKHSSMNIPYPDIENGDKLVCSVNEQKFRIYDKNDKIKYVMNVFGGGPDMPRSCFETNPSIRGKRFFTKEYNVGARNFVSFLGDGEYLIHSILTDGENNILEDRANDMQAISHGCIRLSVPDSLFISTIKNKLKIKVED